MVQGVRRVALLQEPVAQHGDAVAHRHRLDLVVGDVHGRDGEPGLELGELGPVCTRSLASRFESGSSIRNTCGSRTIARPIATR